MNERDLADRFSRDVNNLLSEAGRTDSEPLPPEYHQALALARTLATTDFSGESQVRESLRCRLLKSNRIGAREGWPLRKENPMHTFFWRRHPVLSLATIALAALLLVTLVWPGTLTAAAQRTEVFLQSLVLGQDTEIHRVSPDRAAPAGQKALPARPVAEQKGDHWIIRTAIGNFGGNVPPGHDATVRHFPTFEEVQAALPFSLRQPGYLPTGYTFREAMVGPIGSAFLFYGGPDGDIVLVQMPTGEQPGGGESEAIVARVMTLTDKPIELVTMSGRSAAWIEGEGLRWEADGISYVLGGANLSLEEATRIAESLK